MTGLDPASHLIVEIATIVTDDELLIVAEGPDLVVSVPESHLSAMDEVVTRMHTRSGLLDAVRSSEVSLEDAGRLTLEFLRQHMEAGKIPLCGNSIGTDRRFLAAHLPEVEDFFHYRSVDVSTIKELARRWYPSVVSGAPTKKGGHRALDDIRESIEELRYYRSHMFSAADATASSEGAESAAPATGPRSSP